jgi:hypothetical protein
MTANEKKYVPASKTSTAAGLVAAISTPAKTGPRIWVSCVPLLRIALPRATSRSSSPRTYGRIKRDDGV